MNIYVGNTPKTSTQDSLRDLFSEHGAVNSVRIITDRMTGEPRGFAFVEMTSDDEAQAAITALDGSQFEGNTLRVNEARPPQPRREGFGGPRRSGPGGPSRGGYGSRGGNGGGGNRFRF